VSSPGRPGDIVAGRFQLDRTAGSGGMGVVYRAIDLQSGGHVALKIFTGEGDREAERFDREAHVLAELRHPGVVRYLAHGVTADGDRWIAMEWLDGITLNEALKKRALGIDESVHLVQRVAEAVGFAHRRGIVHRDLKPANLFLPDGALERVKVLDFGVAMVRRAARQLTQTGVPVGTPGYMAPEQARGMKDVDARADVFALGCVLFRCLTGRRAFTGSDMMAVLTKVILEDVPRVSTIREDVPQALDDIVARMLRKPAIERPADAVEVADLLQRIAGLAAVRQSVRPPKSSVALTTGERKVLCILMARPGQPFREPGADTVRGYGTPTPEVELSETVARFGGEPEFLADGSLLAVFRTGGAATDQATRAARCALALQRLLTAVPIAIAAGRSELADGMHTGEVIERGIRLLSIERPAGVRIDNVIGGLLDARFEVSASPQGLELRSERDVAEMLRTVLGRPTECVGRARELGTLDALLRECVDESVARVALLLGAPGVGKSRLRHEFVRRIRARGESVELWTARGDAGRAGSPFGLISPGIRRAAGIHDGDPIELKHERLRARVAQNVAASEVSRVTEFLGEMVGAQFSDESSTQLRAARLDATLMGDQMQRAFLDFLAGECARGPLVLVLEDLHWGDLPSIRFLDFALRALRDRPLFVLALARPEVYDAFPRLWDERNVQEIRVGELTKRACETLVRQVMGDTLTAEQIERMVDRSAGNAFCLEELLRAVAVNPDDELPSTVLAMVQARLEALGQETRRVLRAASVFGDVFWLGGVAALFGGIADPTQLSEWITELVEREIIVPRAEAKFPDEREYRFRHSLVREAAYAMLTDADRPVGHRLAADWLSAAGESDAMVLALHLERGGEPLRAIEWYRCAAEQALEANDFAAAIARADKAVVCGASGEVLGAIRGTQAEAHRWRGELADAERCAFEALTLLPRGSARWARAAADAAGGAGPLGHHDALVKLAADAKRAFGASGRRDVLTRETSAQMVGTARIALQLLHQAEYSLADDMLRLVESLGGTSGTQEPVSAGHVARARGVRALYQGDGEDCLVHMHEAVDAFRRAGDVRSAAVTSVDMGFTLNELGAFEESETNLRQAFADGERFGLATVRAFVHNALIVPLLHTGRVEEAERSARTAIEMFAAQGDRRFEGSSHTYLALVLAHAGDLEGAENEARAALALLDAAPPIRAEALAVLASTLLARGRTVEAMGEAQRAWDLLVTLGSIELGDSYVRLSVAETLHASGVVPEARRVLGEARDRLISRASKITRPALRESFLAKIPENARTFQRASEWSVQ